MKLFRIETGNFMVDGGAMFGVIPKSMWIKRYPCDENNLCNLSMRSILIDYQDHVTLIDAGIGTYIDQKFLSHYYLNGNDTLLKSLQQTGYHPDMITDVIFTHLHFDHCSGALQPDENNQIVSIFKNAVFHVSKKQMNWAYTPNDRESAAYPKMVIDAINNHAKLNLIETDGFVLPGIELRLYYGHTPGIMVPFIHHNEALVIYPTDVVPVMASVSPLWISAYDIEPLVSLDEKKKLLEEAVKNDAVLFFQHDLYNQCCKVEKTTRGFKESAVFEFKTLI